MGVLIRRLSAGQTGDELLMLARELLTLLVESLGETDLDEGTLSIVEELLMLARELLTLLVESLGETGLEGDITVY